MFRGPIRRWGFTPQRCAFSRATATGLFLDIAAVLNALNAKGVRCSTPAHTPRGERACSCHHRGPRSRLLRVYHGEDPLARRRARDRPRQRINGGRICESRRNKSQQRPCDLRRNWRSARRDRQRVSRAARRPCGRYRKRKPRRSPTASAVCAFDDENGKRTSAPRTRARRSSL